MLLKFLLVFLYDFCICLKTTGLTTWAPRARESVLEKCEYELRTNPVYIETDIGRTLADGVLGGMCPGDCSGHGQCSRGVYNYIING